VGRRVGHADQILTAFGDSSVVSAATLVDVRAAGGRLAPPALLAPRRVRLATEHWAVSPAAIVAATVVVVGAVTPQVGAPFSPSAVALTCGQRRRFLHDDNV
jgi:hypothetical protein